MVSTSQYITSFGSFEWGGRPRSLLGAEPTKPTRPTRPSSRPNSWIMTVGRHGRRVAEQGRVREDGPFESRDRAATIGEADDTRVGGVRGVEVEIEERHRLGHRPVQTDLKFEAEMSRLVERLRGRGDRVLVDRYRRLVARFMDTFEHGRDRRSRGGPTDI